MDSILDQQSLEVLQYAQERYASVVNRARTKEQIKKARATFDKLLMANIEDPDLLAKASAKAEPELRRVALERAKKIEANEAKRAARSKKEVKKTKDAAQRAAKTRKVNRQFTDNSLDQVFQKIEDDRKKRQEGAFLRKNATRLRRMGVDLNNPEEVEQGKRLMELAKKNQSRQQIQESVRSKLEREGRFTVANGGHTEQHVRKAAFIPGENKVEEHVKIGGESAIGSTGSVAGVPKPNRFSKEDKHPAKTTIDKLTKLQNRLEDLKGGNVDFHSAEEIDDEIDRLEKSSDELSAMLDTDDMGQLAKVLKVLRATADRLDKDAEKQRKAKDKVQSEFDKARGAVRGNSTEGQGSSGTGRTRAKGGVNTPNSPLPKKGSDADDDVEEKQLSILQRLLNVIKGDSDEEKQERRRKRETSKWKTRSGGSRMSAMFHSDGTGNGLLTHLLSVFKTTISRLGLLAMGTAAVTALPNLMDRGHRAMDTGKQWWYELTGNKDKLQQLNQERAQYAKEHGDQPKPFSTFEKGAAAYGLVRYGTKPAYRAAKATVSGLWNLVKRVKGGGAVAGEVAEGATAAESVAGAAGIRGAIGSILRFGLKKAGPIAMLISGVVDGFKGFQKDATKKLLGDATMLNRVRSMAIGILSGLTGGLLSPERIRDWTDDIGNGITWAIQHAVDAAKGLWHDNFGDTSKDPQHPSTPVNPGIGPKQFSPNMKREFGTLTSKPMAGSAVSNNFIIDKVAQQNGLNSSMMRTISSIETGHKFNADAKNPGSSAYGLFQQLDSNWRTYGKGLDRNNPKDQATAAARYLKDIHKTLKAGLGREPQPWEMYLGYQQGGAGALKMLKADPNASAAAVVGKDQAGLNGMGGKTVGQSLAMWQQKYAIHEAANVSLADTGYRTANRVDPNAKGSVFPITYGQEGKAVVSAAPMIDPTGGASSTVPQGAATASAVQPEADSHYISQYELMRQFHQMHRDQAPAQSPMMIMPNPGDNTPKPGLGMPTVIEDSGLILFNGNALS